MKKLLYVVCFLLTLTSCDLRFRKGEDISETNKTEISLIKTNLVYFKDENTGLCFVALNNNTNGYRNTFSITCVPCDSIKFKL